MQKFTFTLKLKTIFLSLLALISIACFNTNLHAQAADSKGKDFWLMFNGNYSNNPTLTLFITSGVNTSGTVTIPGLGFNQAFSVTANTVTPVIVPTSLSVHVNDVVDNNGIHVTANDEVTVYGLNQIPFTTDAYLGLPTDVLGTEYLLLNYSPGFSGSQLGIVGTVNGTTVTINLASNAAGHTAGVPYNITLNQGQTYELETSSGDLSGTLITSTQPVGVMGAVRCANIPPGASYCDHICEMIPPTSTFGTSFGAVPLKSRINGDTWRFMASENNTTVKINGVAEAPINRGQFIEKILTTQSYIESDKPILVAEYANGSGFSGNPGDPFMMLIPSLQQFLPGYTLTTVSGFVAHYINLVAPNSIVGQLTLDGVAVPASEFTPIGTSGFSGAQLTVTDGSHTLAGALPFGAFQYGFNADDSYGYAGGQSFSPVATVNSLTLTPVTGTGSINTQQCFSALVKDQFNNPVVGVRVDFNISGPNAATSFANTDASGIATFCYTGANAGKDVITASIGNISDVSEFTWTSNPCNVRCTISVSPNPTITGGALNTIYIGNGPQSVTLTGDGSGGTGPYTYDWGTAGTGSSITVSPTVTTTYILTVTDANQCTSTCRVTINVIPAGNVCNEGTISCSIRATPNYGTPEDVLNTIYIGYAAQCFKLTATVAGGVKPLRYAWSGGTRAGYDSIRRVCPTATTTYTVTITDANGCVTTCSITINVVDVRCGPNLDQVVLCYNNQEICVPKSMVIGYLRLGAKLGNCPITITRKRNSIEISDINAATTSVKVYPNPSKKFINVEWKADQNDQTTLKIIDMQGRVLMNRQYNGLLKQATNIKKLDLDGFAKGLYMLQLTSKTGSKTTRFTIE